MKEQRLGVASRAKEMSTVRIMREGSWGAWLGGGRDSNVQPPLHVHLNATYGSPIIKEPLIDITAWTMNFGILLPKGKGASLMRIDPRTPKANRATHARPLTWNRLALPSKGTDALPRCYPGVRAA